MEQEDITSFLETLVPYPTKHCFKCRRAEEDTAAARLLLCSRCKVARYCSRNCQRTDFSLHRNACKSIACLREQQSENRVALANAIVEMTYRSCDTIECGADGFASAARLYVEDVMKTGSVSSRVKAAFLLAALGHDAAAVSIIYQQRFDPTPSTQGKQWLYPLRNPFDNLLDFDTSNVKSDHEHDPYSSVTEMVILVFIKMRIVANIRIRQDNFKKAFVPCTKSILTKKIIGTIRDYYVGPQDFYDSQQVHLSRHVDALNEIFPSFQRVLLESIPLTPLEPEAPYLFHRDDTPNEFWYLLQDCFLLTRGVNELLDDEPPEELVPEES